MNRVILMGRLTKDPVVSYTSGDNSMAVARFTLAVDRRVKKEANQENTADFIGCVAFGRQGEFAEKYLKKGTKVVLEGRIQTGSYEKEGVRHYTTDVIAENLEFAESKAASQNNSSPSQGRPTPADADGFMDISDSVEDEGLPFN